MHKKSLLDELRKKETEDQTLPLKETANNLVFGEGNPNTQVIFLGEAPGRFEDQSGLPFVGSAGKLLDKLLESVNLKRKDVFITSVLHYRPPKNRDPKPAEIESFAPYINQIIEIINPKIIATLGRYSLKKFLPDVKIAKVHGKPQKINWQGKDIIILPLYHPAAVLYTRKIESVLFEDFKVLKNL